MSKSGVLIFLSSPSFVCWNVFIGGNLSLDKYCSSFVSSNCEFSLFLYRGVLFLDLAFEN